MPRLALVVILLFPLVASAQDMPLFTFTKEGETWVKADGKKPEKDEFDVKSLKGGRWDAAFTLGGDRYTLTYYHQEPLLEMKRDWVDLARPNSSEYPVFARTADKNTVYVGFSNEVAVWAFTVDKDGELTNGAPYAPLCIRKSYDNSKEVREKLRTNPTTMAVMALTIDSAGRLYAATPDGVQVFDPAGRLSGVLLLPAKGKVEALVWQGEKKDVLATWIGEQKWTRKMNIKKD